MFKKKMLVLLCRVGLFTLRSLAFNKANSRAVVLDTAFKPVFWVVDHFVGILGPVFVVLVVGLISTVVVIYYSTILPTILEQHIIKIVLHVVVAHWLLLNICFHYFKAVFTSPGHPPQADLLPGRKENYLVCKKCLQAKPPRTHHCSICNKCIMKMDHHCPWINNCVGHFNHRYFILFCFYLTLGTFYVGLSSWDLFTQHFFDVKGKELHVKSLDKLDSRSRAELLRIKVARLVALGGYNSLSDFEHNSAIFVFMLCSAVTLALGLLTMWHARLIAKGETSIELHINKFNRRTFKKKGLIYKNPYDFGAWDNWRILLGLVNGRSWGSVLFPSSHHPYGNGLKWPPPPKNYKAILPL